MKNFSHNKRPKNNLSKQITLKSEAGPVILPICGAIYYTDNHFVSRIISPTGEVWHYDGIETKYQCIHEGHLLVIDFSESSIKNSASRSDPGTRKLQKSRTADQDRKKPQKTAKNRL